MQFKHLAELFAGTEKGSPAEKRYGFLLVNYVLGRTLTEEELNTLTENLLTVENQVARSGLDRCECGCKYWENDRCIDCRLVYDPEKFQEED